MSGLKILLVENDTGNEWLVREYLDALDRLSFRASILSC